MGICLADDEIVDTDELNTTIVAVSAKAGNAVAGNDIGQYPLSAIEALNEAIAIAQTIADDTGATAEEIEQAVTDLLAAERLFDASKIITADRTALTSAIKAATTKAENATAGNDIGQYPLSAISSFKLAIDKAKTVADDTGATAEEIEQAVTDLLAAERLFDASKITTVDKTALTSAIKAATTKAENAIAGDDIGQYPLSAISSFKLAIDKAKTVADDTGATMEEVDQAVADLLEAERLFDASKITTVDKTALTSAIKAATTKAENAVAGNDIGQYPQSAIDALNEAIAIAQIITDDTGATLEEVREAVKDLLAAERIFDDARVTTGEIIPLEPVTDLKATAIGANWINWSWINPNDEDFSHVMVYMNGTFAANTSFSFYNATGLAEGMTYDIGICTVDIHGNISSAWTNGSATTLQLPRIYDLSGTNVTDSSVTLIWEASNDTALVKIGRDGAILGNVNGSTFFVDSDLSSGTTYSYTLVPYNGNGLAGMAVSIGLTTSSADDSGGGSSGGSSSTKSSSGGGGGGSGEDYENIALKDVDNEYVRAHANVSYEFTRAGNDIRSVSFYSLKNAGDIKSTVEVLHNRSGLVHSSPEGLVYRYINIWVGNSDFATEANIRDACVQFRVNGSWIEDMDVRPEDVRLQRYDRTAWEVLPATLVNSTTDYMVFESDVPGFSSFAITAEKAVASPANTGTDTAPVQEEAVSTEQVQPERSGVWTFFAGILALEAVAVGFEYRRRKRKRKT